MHRPRPETPRILAIHAHPDDVEILFAGTLIKLQEKGCHIEIATMSPGDCGSAEYDAIEIAEIRRKEAKKAAELIGVNYTCLEFRDFGVFNDDDGRRRVTEFVRSVRPDIVLTAPPVDYMCDHEATSLLVRDACFTSSAPNYDTKQENPAKPTEAIPFLYYADPIEGVDHFSNPIKPDFIVDVSNEVETKMEMLACHESQRNWLKRQHGMDEYLDSCKRWCAKRGTEIGVAYGEGFRQHTGHPYPGNNLLVEILEE